MSRTKRFFDLFMCFLVIVICLPIMIVIRLVYLLYPGGPFFFQQQRVGLNGRAFTLFKIRTLVLNHKNPKAAMKKDDGTVIPGMGSFLREWRLDEIFQIYNILKGEMSWVGPRPEQVVFSQEFEQINPEYSLRYKAKPGLAGLAQIHNPDAVIDDFQEKLVHDLEYIKTASLGLDLKILLLSFKKVIFG